MCEKGGGEGGRSRVMTKPPRVGICLGRSKAYLCLKFLGRSRPRLIHFLKIHPLMHCRIIVNNVENVRVERETNP